MKSRYDVMTESIVKDTDGQNYPDPISFPANNFVTDQNTLKVVLNKQDIIWPSKLMVELYGSAEYDDIVFWLNDIDFIPDLIEGEELEVPTITALEDFLLLNRT